MKNFNSTSNLKKTILTIGLYIIALFAWGGIQGGSITDGTDFLKESFPHILIFAIVFLAFDLLHGSKNDQ